MDKPEDNIEEKPRRIKAALPDADKVRKGFEKYDRVMRTENAAKSRQRRTLHQTLDWVRRKKFKATAGISR